MTAIGAVQCVEGHTVELPGGVMVAAGLDVSEVLVSVGGAGTALVMGLTLWIFRAVVVMILLEVSD